MFVALTLGVLLPVRLLFSEHVSDHWVGSLGVVTIYAILIWYLAKKDKLGVIGKIFERQLNKTLAGKIGKYFAVITFLFLVYFGSSLILIERGYTVYAEDSNTFYSKFLDAESPSSIQIDPAEINGPKNPNLATPHNTQHTDSKMATDSKGPTSIVQNIRNLIDVSFHIVGTLDYSFSVSYSIMDRVMDGWLTHIYVILFVENIEVAGLVIIYRQDPNIISSCIAKLKRVRKLQ